MSDFNLSEQLHLCADAERRQCANELWELELQVKQTLRKLHSCRHEMHDCLHIAERSRLELGGLQASVSSLRVAAARVRHEVGTLRLEASQKAIALEREYARVAERRMFERFDERVALRRRFDDDAVAAARARTAQASR